MTKPSKPKNLGGRPPIVCTEELANEICETLAAKTLGMEILCKQNPHWPSHDTIYRWIQNQPGFRDKYARAKMAQTEMMVDKMYNLIEQSSSEEWGKTRLLIDTIKWKACKLVPKVYGDRTQSDVTMTVKQADAIDELA